MACGLLFELYGSTRDFGSIDNGDHFRRIETATLVGAATFAVPIPIFALHPSAASGFLSAAYAGAAMLLQTIGYSGSYRLILRAVLPHAVGLIGACGIIGYHYYSEGSVVVPAIMMIAGPIFIAMIWQLYRDLSEKEERLLRFINILKKQKELALEHKERARRNEAISKKASEAKSSFLARMSHELRTPMNGILGLADLMSTQHDDPTVRNSSQIIKVSAEQLLNRINNILDYSNFETGEVELENETFDIHQTLTDVHNAGLAQKRTNHVDLRLIIAADFPQYVTGDERRIHQIIFNLFENALKFTQDGKVFLKADLGGRNRPDAPRHLMITVIDTGIGIKPDKLKSMFRAFTQASEGSKRLFDGMGLGLSFTKIATERMGGFIEASSKEGVGSAFRVTLPLTDQNAIQPAAVVKAGQTPDRTRENRAA